MVSTRAGVAYKYTRTEGTKIYILQIQKGCSSPCINGQSSSISLFGKNGRDKKPTHDSGDKENMEIFFNQSDHTYCRIPAGDFTAEYQGGQGFQGMKNSSSEWVSNNPIFSKLIQDDRTSGCGSVCIQVVPPDPKVHKPATRSSCMDAGCISNKLDKPKGITFPPFVLIGRAIAKAMKDKCTLIIVTPVWPSQPWCT